ncbi:MAG TPA: dienelactone hydrolase family protein [Thermodesulfobacteriota bacterium]
MKKVSNLISIFILTCLFSVVIVLNTYSEDLPEGKMVSYKSDGETVSGFLVTPTEKGPFPAIIVIHEWWGINNQIQNKAKELAKEGYVTLVVDLYRGKATTDPEEAHELLRGLPEDRAMRDMLSAVSYLKTLPIVKKDKIGSIGWCMGGGYSLSLAINSPDISACAVYYGRLVTDKNQLRKINASVIGFFGDEDKGIPVSSVKAFEEDMKELGKDVSIYIYNGAGHAFANEEKPSYVPKAAIDSWEKSLTFFNQKLK